MTPEKNVVSRYSGVIHRFSIHISYYCVCVVCARVKACFIQKHRMNDPIELLTLLSYICKCIYIYFSFNFECTFLLVVVVVVVCLGILAMQFNFVDLRCMSSIK